MQLPATRASQGSLLLSLAIVVCIVSIALAATAGYLAWQKSGRSWSPLLQTFSRSPSSPTPTPAAIASPDPLAPTFEVDAALVESYAELEQKLLAPLRAYYATKTERLAKVKVSPAAETAHTSQVTFDEIKDGRTTTRSFFYDRAGKDKAGPFAKWEPGMLDNTQ